MALIDTLHKLNQDRDFAAACEAAYNKIERCIQSTETHDQLATCERMIDAFEVLFVDEFMMKDFSKSLRKLLAVHREFTSTIG
jgi:hypothetical protein